MPRHEGPAPPADTGILAHGASLAEVFENAAFGMFDLVFDLRGVTASEGCRVAVEAETREELLGAWLSGLLAEAEIRGLALARFAVEGPAGGRLLGTGWGGPSAGPGM